MTDSPVSRQHHATFEELRRTEEDGNEYWLARQLAPALEYSQYRHFLPAVERAKTACEQSGQPVTDHFEDILTMVDIGSGAKRQIGDIRLSRYACYLIVQNGDPSKPVIANGQTYFAIDHMGSTELAANLFRATQTEEKLRRDGIKGKQQANQTHFAVGQKVRQTIEELGGTMPEDLPTPERSIKQLESAQGKLPKKDD